MSDAGPTVRLKLRSADPPAAPEWVELPGGLRVLLRPRSGILDAAVQMRIGQELAAFRAATPNLAAYGFDPPEAGRLLDPELAAAFAGFLIAVVQAAVYLSDWNLVDDAGASIPITGRNVSTLFREGLDGDGGWLLLDAFATALEMRNAPPAVVEAAGASDVAA